MVSLYAIAFLSGVGIGFLCLSQILYPLYFLLPRYDELYDVTKLEHSVLLYTILRVPVVWATLLLTALLSVIQFFPNFQIHFFFGLMCSLIFVIVELISKRGSLEAHFMDSLRGAMLAPETEEDAKHKYVQYSVQQMRSMGWKAKSLDVARYGDLVYECAICNERSKISDSMVYLRGNGNRYVVECGRCQKPSIIRITNVKPSGFRVFTEARLPEADKYYHKRNPGRRFDTT